MKMCRMYLRISCKNQLKINNSLTLQLGKVCIFVSENKDKKHLCGNRAVMAK
jgi:hypothetical protein